MRKTAAFDQAHWAQIRFPSPQKRLIFATSMESCLPDGRQPYTDFLDVRIFLDIFIIFKRG